MAGIIALFQSPPPPPMTGFMRFWVRYNPTTNTPPRWDYYPIQQDPHGIMMIIENFIDEHDEDGQTEVDIPRSLVWDEFYETWVPIPWGSNERKIHLDALAEIYECRSSIALETEKQRKDYMTYLYLNVQNVQFFASHC